jgi:8-oxo-dGTP diphosphatase
VANQDNMTPHREMAGSVVLDIEGRFLIQRRDDNPAIPYPGKLAFFGGLREGNETFLECAVREFIEELTYAPSVTRFEHFMSYEGPDLEFVGYSAKAEVFIVRNVPIGEVIVNEGSLVIAGFEDLPSLAHEFAPLSRHILDALLVENRPTPNSMFRSSGGTFGGPALVVSE